MNEVSHWDDKIQESAKKFGTPLYVYSYERLKHDYFSVRQAIPSEVTLYYSMKCNPNPEICRYMLGWGSPIEVASIGEYESAVKIGTNPQSIVFTGPGKDEKEMEICLQRGIYCINVESLHEMEKVNEVAAKLQLVAPIMIRVNLNIGKQGSRMASVGVPSQFGIDEDQLDEVISRAVGSPHLRLLGLHTYQGTQNFHLDFYQESIPRMFELSRKFMEQYRIQFTAIGLGGGFGVPYFVDDEPFPIEAYGAYLKEQVSLNGDLGISHIFIESGRFLTSRMGCYVTKVLYTKTSYGKQFVIVDGGTHQRAFSTVMGGRSFKQPLPVRLIRNGGVPDDSPQATVTLAGKLCTPTDVLQSNVALPQPMQDDLLVFVHSGAYGLTCGNVHFLSHELPREIMFYPDGSYRDISWLTEKSGNKEAEYV